MEQKGDLDKINAVVEEYKVVIDTQMHFNEMLMRMRTTAFSVIIAIFGAAAAVLGQYPTKYIIIANFQFHLSASVIFLGLILLLAIFIMDYCYYYKMLVGAVERGYEFDVYFKDQIVGNGFKFFGMSSKIRDRIGRPGMSKLVLFAFYGIIGLGGIIYLSIILLFI